ncbi:MAG: hypothetical protein Q7T42_03210 [Methylotenera sp.]|uniref:hypothetical protein n=1 Tax=Methylotenera sp. TaxID=2051956 RepID=UPI0027158DA5|nr:hypothetical protein [Methylotenera sp.]MDO9392968.1 hypothetical protein [Methylotenera sp.]
MSIEKLLDNKCVRTAINERFEAGESFEIISLKTGEKMTSEEVKQKIDSKN